MNRTSALCFTLALVLASGCVVSQSTHDALKKDLDDTRAQLTARNGRLQGELDAERTSLQREQTLSRELGEKIATLETDLAAARKARSTLEGERAAMVKDKSRLQASIEEMQSALSELARRKAEADARIGEFKNLLGRFKSLIDAGKLKVKIADGRMVVELASDVLFASGSATLNREGKAALFEVGRLLAEISDRRFQVEGHTDNVPIATAQYPSNWELAAARAITVLKTMVEAGVPVGRISAASLADGMPARVNDSPEGRAANRRIEIVVVPDLSSLPGFDELKRVSAQ